jgi:hypothetical protein
MQMLKSLAFAALALGLAATTSSADVHVTLNAGRVTIVAKDATLRQILTEWARVGQIKVVNLERVPGGPMTLELTNVPEARALETLLRPLSGYIAAPRVVTVANASNFDRIVVMPTLAQPRAGLAAAPPPVFTPIAPPPVDDDVDDERPAPPVGGPTPNPRGPVFNTFPQPQVVAPQQTMPYQGEGGANMPNGATPNGVAVPGMMVAPPAPQPGQPGQMPQPGQVLQPGQVAQPGQVLQPGQVPGAPAKRPGGGPGGPGTVDRL